MSKDCLWTINYATLLWFLSQRVIPIYSVPRKPFSQVLIKGNSSIFSRKFWRRINFKSVKEIDKKLEWFNKDSERYLKYQKPKLRQKAKRNFIPKIYFIRQVRDNKEQINKAFIDILNEKVSLFQSYINYFVLVEWNLKEEMLYIWFEKEQEPKIIKKQVFKINQRSKEKLTKII